MSTDRETLREELAEVIASGLRVRQPVETIADALLPVVERATVRAQQQALRDAAQELGQPYNYGVRGVNVADLLGRADALGAHDGEEGQ